jgi:hypothetical protein
MIDADFVQERSTMGTMETMGKSETEDAHSENLDLAAASGGW